MNENNDSVLVRAKKKTTFWKILTRYLKKYDKDESWLLDFWGIRPEVLRLAQESARLVPTWTGVWDLIEELHLLDVEAHELLFAAGHGSAEDLFTSLIEWMREPRTRRLHRGYTLAQLRDIFAEFEKKGEKPPALFNKMWNNLNADLPAEEEDS